MPYQQTHELPETLQASLPEPAQEVYIKAYNEALTHPDLQARGGLSDESAAHAIAWQAVEREFVKDSEGRWHSRDEAPNLDDEAEDPSIMERLKGLFTS